jgi:hypothetical protein
VPLKCHKPLGQSHGECEMGCEMPHTRL